MLSSTSDGTHWLQTRVPFEHEAVCCLLSEMRQQGVSLPAVTSMNVSGRPEIVDQREGIDFCATYDIPLFLMEPNHRAIVQGSFPIIHVDEKGIKLIREGDFPGLPFRDLLEAAIDRSEALPSRYPLVQTHSPELVADAPAHQLRRELIATLDGWETAS